MTLDFHSESICVHPNVLFNKYTDSAKRSVRPITEKCFCKFSFARPRSTPPPARYWVILLDTWGKSDDRNSVIDIWISGCLK